MHKARFTNAMKLLDEERAALRAGHLAKVAELTSQKVELVQDLSALRLSAGQARKLRDSADHNAKLLEAALSGMRAAQERLTALRAVRSGLNIYDSKGSKQTVARSNGGMEHKV